MLAKALLRQSMTKGSFVVGTSASRLVARQSIMMASVRGFSANTASIEKSI